MINISNDPTWFRAISFLIAASTNVGAIVATVIMGYWFFVRLKYSKTSLRPLIGSFALADANVWLWSMGNMVAIAFYHQEPPISTLPARLLWLAVLLIQIRTTTRIRPSQALETIAAMTKENQETSVLILEDDPDIADIYCAALDTLGFVSEIAATGAAALAYLERHKPGIVIVDIKLPDMTGVQFLALARIAGYLGPAIAVSGALSVMDKEQLTHFVDGLQKPFKPSELIDAVQRHIVEGSKQ